MELGENSFARMITRNQRAAARRTRELRFTQRRTQQKVAVDATDQIQGVESAVELRQNSEAG